MAARRRQRPVHVVYESRRDYERRRFWGVLLSFEEPSPGMCAEAAEAGFYESPWGMHPRIQLRMVGELLAGKRVDYPPVTGANVTFKRAARATAAAPDPAPLFEVEP